MAWSGIEPATSRSRVRRANHSATLPHCCCCCCFVFVFLLLLFLGGGVVVVVVIVVVVYRGALDRQHVCFFFQAMEARRAITLSPVCPSLFQIMEELDGFNIISSMSVSIPGNGRTRGL